MDDKQQPKGWGLGTWAAIAFGLLLLYLISFGPVLMLVKDTPMEWIVMAYLPLELAAGVSPVTEAWFDWYVDLFA